MPNVYIRREGTLPRVARRVGAWLHWRALWRRGIQAEAWRHGLPPRMLRIQHVNCRCWPSPIMDNFGIHHQLPDTPPPDRPRFTP